MNEYGLCLANMEVDRQMRPPMAMPYTLLYRTVLEQCRTVDEAIDLLKRTPRQSANNLMLMDARGEPCRGGDSARGSDGQARPIRDGADQHESSARPGRRHTGVLLAI